jgi:hypothetical protein
MRLPRIVGYLILGAILGVLFVYCLGWRKTPILALVNDKSGSADFVLQKGQILKWESANGDPFRIVWQYGVSPCKEGITIESKKDFFTGIETATCEVVNGPPPHSTYSYAIASSRGPLVGPQTVPCNGCVYTNNNVSGAVVKMASRATTDTNVIVSCGSDMATGHVIFDGDSPVLVPVGLTLTWVGVGNDTIGPPTNFLDPKGNDAGVTCGTNDGYTCTFPSDPSKYPISYSINVTGNDKTTPPAYCSKGSIAGDNTQGTVSGLAKAL